MEAVRGRDAGQAPGQSQGRQLRTPGPMQSVREACRGVPVPVLSLRRSSSASESSTSTTSSRLGASFWKSRSHAVSRSL